MNPKLLIIAALLLVICLILIVVHPTPDTGAAENLVQITFKNNFKVAKKLFVRMTKGGGVTWDDGQNLAADKNAKTPVVIQPGQTKTLNVMGTMISAVAWIGLDRKLPWRGESEDDNICSLFEWTITHTNVSYDISAVEGLCSSWKITWNPNSGKGSSKNNLLCNPKPNSQFPGPYVKSDKWQYKDNPLTGCGFSSADKKEQCHKWYDQNSYKNGYCKWLYDNNCQGYCWAYDEMKCPEGQNCGYNRDGNPVLQGTNRPADKTVKGAPTNPQPARGSGGTLLVEFGPLDGSTFPPPPPPPSKPDILTPSQCKAMLSSACKDTRGLSPQCAQCVADFLQDPKHPKQEKCASEIPDDWCVAPVTPSPHSSKIRKCNPNTTPKQLCPGNIECPPSGICPGGGGSPTPTPSPHRHSGKIIKCNPNTTPKQMCPPGNIPCPSSGECPVVESFCDPPFISCSSGCDDSPGCVGANCCQGDCCVNPGPGVRFCMCHP